MKKLLSTVSLVIASLAANAFCGFYVAKADGKLFNKSSQVIMVRNSETNANTITMANDYEGDFNEFAMVVPVPVVLKEKNIRVVRKDLFDRFDAYSAPRLAEYYDENPCYEMDYEIMENATMSVLASGDKNIMRFKSEYKGVSIEAQYEVGEYDILILSAKESNGLKNWLTDNGYKIPTKASEVLTPYIKNDMKFFVAKVNTKRLKQKNGKYLSPIQISFKHNKFMLPIRLGMANSDGYQDLIVHAFTQNGRVETTNYQTKMMPSNKQVPLFVNDVFGDFYKSVFSKAHSNNKKAVFVEYAWDLDGKNFTKCDPCNTTPPSIQELKNAGVDWVQPTNNRWGANYTGNLHFTRLHVRYNRSNFPQDLVFTETQNKHNFQCRYILTHPAKITDEACDEVLPYYEEVQERRINEMQNLDDLTWWGTDRYQSYLAKYENKIKTMNANDDENQNHLLPIYPKNTPFEGLIIIAILSTLTLVATRKYALK